jgi:hypothetical protein
MDAQRLEALSRTLASGPSRRAVLAGLGVLLTGGALSHPAPVAGEEGWVLEAEAIKLCRLPGFPCTRRSQCCGGGCSAEGTCGCRKRGQSAALKAVCCSGRKKSGDKGVCR